MRQHVNEPLRRERAAPWTHNSFTMAAIFINLLLHTTPIPLTHVTIFLTLSVITCCAANVYFWHHFAIAHPRHNTLMHIFLLTMVGFWLLRAWVLVCWPRYSSPKGWWINLFSKSLSTSRRKMVAFCASSASIKIQESSCSINVILKAVVAINNITLANMEVPESYLESLSKNDRRLPTEWRPQCIHDAERPTLMPCLCTTMPYSLPYNCFSL